MNHRERVLAVAVLTLVVLIGCGAMVYQFFLVPLHDKRARLVTLQNDLETKRDRISQVLAEKPKLERWRQMSLPVDIDVARREYEKYLSQLLRDSGLGNGSFVTPKPADTKSSPTVPGKKDPIFTRLGFTVTSHGDLASLVDFMERFYNTSLLQQIVTLDIQRPTTLGAQQSPTDLTINLNVEALVLANADKRQQLMPSFSRKLVAVDVMTVLQGGAPGLALVPWALGPTGPLGPGKLADPPRQYASIAGKNIFFGPPPAVVRNRDNVDVTQFVYLNDITRTGGKAEAWLYDRYNNRKTRLRASPGFDSFRVRGNQGEVLLSGRVIRLEDRDLIFRANDKVYSMHIGSNLEETLKQPLKAQQVKDLGLAANRQTE